MPVIFRECSAQSSSSNCPLSLQPCRFRAVLVLTTGQMAWSLPTRALKSPSMKVLSVSVSLVYCMRDLRLLGSDCSVGA